jgi:hypothetical protein
MFLFTRLNLLLDGRKADDSRLSAADPGGTDSPRAEVTSAAWEGWWFEDAA